MASSPLAQAGIAGVAPSVLVGVGLVLVLVAFVVVFLVLNGKSATAFFKLLGRGLVKKLTAEGLFSLALVVILAVFILLFVSSDNAANLLSTIQGSTPSSDDTVVIVGTLCVTVVLLGDLLFVGLLNRKP